MAKSIFWAILLGFPLLWLALLGVHRESSPPQAPTPAKVKKSARVIQSRIDEAFALPRGAVLNPKQKAALKELREKHEPPLREAYEELVATTGAREKVGPSVKIKVARAEIRQEIQKLVKDPALATKGKANANTSG